MGNQIEEYSTLPGETVTDDMIALLNTLSDFTGWKRHEGRPVYVEGRAVAYRTPYPRYSQEKFPLRSTYAAYQVHDATYWRELERFVRYAKLPVSNALIGKLACQLITMFDTQGAIPCSAEQQPAVLIDPTHALTHFPKLGTCEACQRSKIRRKQCFRQPPSEIPIDP